MFKRIMFFMAINVAVIVTISIVTSLLGVNQFLTAAGINYGMLAVFCLIWGMAGSFISLMISKWMAKFAMGVRIVDQDPSYARLVGRIHQLARMAQLEKMPEVGVYDSPEINAFATGPSRNNSLVAVSTGLLHHMNDDEVEGVLGHEVAHIANGDMVSMALIQGVINAFVMFLARIAAFALQNVLRNRDDDESPIASGWIYHISVFVFEIFFSFLAMFIVAYFSRIREFRADAGSAKIAGRDKMIASLKALQRTYDNLADTPDTVKCMKISSKKSFMEWLSTHPSLDDRIRALQGS